LRRIEAQSIMNRRLIRIAAIAVVVAVAGITAFIYLARFAPPAPSPCAPGYEHSTFTPVEQGVCIKVLDDQAPRDLSVGNIRTETNEYNHSIIWIAWRSETTISYNGTMRMVLFYGNGTHVNSTSFAFGWSGRLLPGDVVGNEIAYDVAVEEGPFDPATLTKVHIFYIKENDPSYVASSVVEVVPTT
jgi:hypothetical protein